MTLNKPKEKKHATIGNPTINAVIKSLFRFATEKQALDRINQIKDYFVASKKALPAEIAAPNAAVLWIRGYEITETEAEKGYTGNYALIAYKIIDNKFTLEAKKLEVDIKLHPQRKRPKRRHPDWGNPILRSIKKGRVFEYIDDAAAELRRLHEQFPEVSIPGDVTLFLMIYEKGTSKADKGVHKYKFEVKAKPEGGFIIDYKLNVRPKKPEPKRAPAAWDEAGEKQPQGHFAAMVELKRRKKKRTMPVIKPSGGE